MLLGRIRFLGKVLNNLLDESFNKLLDQFWMAFQILQCGFEDDVGHKKSGRPFTGSPLTWGKR